MGKIHKLAKEYAPGMITSVVSGTLFYALVPKHPVWATIIAAGSAIIILLFWTGAVQVRWEKDE